MVFKRSQSCYFSEKRSLKWYDYCILFNLEDINRKMCDERRRRTIKRVEGAILDKWIYLQGEEIYLWLNYAGKKASSSNYLSLNRKEKYIKLKFSQIFSGFGQNFYRLFFLILLVISLFWILYGVTGTVIYKDSKSVLQLLSLDLLYFSFTNFFGCSVDNIVVSGVLGKIIGSLELFFGFLSLAYLVNVFLGSWYSD